MLSLFSGCLFRLMRSSSMRQQWYVLSAGMKRIADLLFVDNLVGTKYSFVEDTKLLVKTDLTILSKEIFNKEWEPPTESSVHRSRVLQRKIFVTLGLEALEATEAGNLKLKLGGVALGDSWISPKDCVLARSPSQRRPLKLSIVWSLLMMGSTSCHLLLVRDTLQFGELMVVKNSQPVVFLAIFLNGAPCWLPR